MESVSVGVYERAVRNCPWCVQLWQNYILLFERMGQSYEKIKGRVPQSVPIVLFRLEIEGSLVLYSPQTMPAWVQIRIVCAPKIAFISLPINLNMCLGAQKNRLFETVLLSTHNICFG